MLRKSKIFMLVVSVFSVIAVMYGALRISVGRASVAKIYRETTTSSKPKVNHEMNQKLVVLYSNQRSGSSFMGEFFNRNPEAFYLYEPLYPFTPHCDFLNYERIDALENMLKCNFFQNSNFFRLANNARMLKKKRRQNLCDTVCFPSRSQAIQYGLKQVMQNKTHKTWPSSINANFLSHLCKKINLIAYKILRICNLHDIDYIYKRLSLQGKELYIVHLIRDPRGIISSKLQLELQQHQMETRTRELCVKMEQNILLVNNSSEPLDFVKDGRYLLVRYEDAATDPLRMAKKVYNFLGLDLPEEVREWLAISVSVSNKSEKEALKLTQPHRYEQLSKMIASPYGTIKDSSITVRKWRKLLHFHVVSKIQSICRTVLEKLNYKIARSNDALLDFSIDLWA